MNTKTAAMETPNYITKITVQPGMELAVSESDEIEVGGIIYNINRVEHVARLKGQPFTDPYVPTHQKGPDYELPSESMYSWTLDGTTRLMEATGDVQNPNPVSVVTSFNKTCKEYPYVAALAVKRGGEWLRWNYSKYQKDVRTAAKGFMKLGLMPRASVAIAASNAPEWFISTMGAIMAGGNSTGIYVTNTSEEVKHILNESKAAICIVDDGKNAAKIMQIKRRIPHLRVVIQFLGEPQEPGVLSWQDLLDIGNSVADAPLERRIRSQAVNQPCSIIYTSGTTGPSKGVLLSQDNITYTANLAKHIMDPIPGKERYLSYLPLSHIAAQITDIFLGMMGAVTVYFGPQEVMKGALKDLLLEVRPTKLLGVPRVYEKMYNSVMERVTEMGSFQKSLYQGVRKMTLHHMENQNHGQHGTPLYYSAISPILRSFHSTLGLDKCQRLVVGAAPLESRIVQYFHSIGLPLFEVYGLSESTGPHTANFTYTARIGSVGVTLPGLDLRINKPNSDGEGEICLKGRNRFMGYLGSEENTMKTLNAEGWLLTGDIGRLDADNFLFITGRIKDLIITSGGFNISPSVIEKNILNELPMLSHVVVIGDKRKFLSAILTFKTIPDKKTGKPTDDLTDEARTWCRSLGCYASSVRALLESNNKQVSAAIQKGINRANQKALTHAHCVQKWVIIPGDLSVAGGELGPTMKVRRNVVVTKFNNVIEKMYFERPSTL